MLNYFDKNIGKTIWFFGLPASGKTTLAKEFIKVHTKYILLDADTIRNTINSDLFFSQESRRENIRRIMELAKFLNENKINCVVSVVTPFEKSRKLLQKNIKNLILIYCKCNVDECKKRDKRGVYKKEWFKETKDFIEVDDIFEEPVENCYILNTEKYTINKCMKFITNIYQNYKW